MIDIHNQACSARRAHMHTCVARHVASTWMLGYQDMMETNDEEEEVQDWQPVCHGTLEFQVPSAFSDLVFCHHLSSFVRVFLVSLPPLFLGGWWRWNTSCISEHEPQRWKSLAMDFAQNAIMLSICFEIMHWWCLMSVMLFDNYMIIIY